MTKSKKKIRKTEVKYFGPIFLTHKKCSNSFFFCPYVEDNKNTENLGFPVVLKFNVPYKSNRLQDHAAAVYVKGCLLFHMPHFYQRTGVIL